MRKTLKQEAATLCELAVHLGFYADSVILMTVSGLDMGMLNHLPAAVMIFGVMGLLARELWHQQEG